MDAAYHGEGIGGALLAALIDACVALGYRQMIAIIGDSDNAASIASSRGAPSATATKTCPEACLLTLF